MSNEGSKQKFVVILDNNAACIVDTSTEAIAIRDAAAKTVSGSQVAKVLFLVDAPEVANCWEVRWQAGSIISASDMGPWLVTPNEPGPAPGNVGIWGACIKADTLGEAVKTATTLAEMARHSTQE